MRRLTFWFGGGRCVALAALDRRVIYLAQRGDNALPREPSCYLEPGRSLRIAKRVPASPRGTLWVARAGEQGPEYGVAFKKILSLLFAGPHGAYTQMTHHESGVASRDVTSVSGPGSRRLGCVNAPRVTDRSDDS